MSHRIDQLNALVQKEVGEILLRVLDIPPGVLVTITKASVADDAESAKLWVSVLPEDRQEAILKLIIENIREIQDLLNKKLVMKFVPKLTFVLDRAAAKAEKITHVLNTLTEEDLGAGSAPKS